MAEAPPEQPNPPQPAEEPPPAADDLESGETPDPEPVQYPEVLAMCPAPDAEQVGINSLISARLSEPIRSDGVLVPFALRCAGTEVDGTLTVSDDKLLFTPSVSLPRNAHCTAFSGTYAVVGPGSASLAREWSFTTASREGTWFAFDESVEVPETRNWALYLLAIAVEEDKIAIAWKLGAELFVSSSLDAGRTFTTVQLASVIGCCGSIDSQFDILLHKGVVHLAWRLLPVNLPSEVFYARSNEDLTAFSAPLMLSDPHDELRALSPTLAVGDEDNVFIGWAETCIDFGCLASRWGIYLVTLFADDSRAPRRRQIKTGMVFNPRIAWVRDHLVVTSLDANLTRIDIHELVDLHQPGERLVERAIVSMTGERPAVQHFKSIGDRLLMFWLEGNVSNDQHLYTAQYDGATRVLSAPRLLMQYPSRDPVVASTMGSVPGGAVLWSVGHHRGWYHAEQFEDDPFFEGVHRHLYFSDDAGDSFLAPQPLDVMSGNEFSSDGVDDLVPMLALSGQSSAAYLAWTRDYGGSTRAVHLARGEPVAPCE